MEKLADITSFLRLQNQAAVSNAAVGAPGTAGRRNGNGVGIHKLGEATRPLLVALDNFVNAAGAFHKWYQMAYRFINAYDREWEYANGAKKDWAGVQARNNVYTRTHNFKPLYDRLKQYSAFSKPPMNNPVVEWSKTSPLIGLLEKLNMPGSKR